MDSKFFGAVSQTYVTYLPDNLTKALELAKQTATSSLPIVFIRKSVVHGLQITRRIELNNHSSTIGVFSARSGIAVWIAREIELLGARFEKSAVRHVGPRP